MPTTQVTLTATVGYGGSLPITTVGWIQDSGPNTATINSPLELTTTVTIPDITVDPDVYVFSYKITIDGSDTTDTVTITVKTNTAPIVTHGGPYADTFPGTVFPITGTYTDADGLPAAGPVDTTWSASGPARTITDDTDLTTNLVIDAAGTLTLTLLGDDGDLTHSVNTDIECLPVSSLGTGYDTTTPDVPGSELTDHTFFVDMSELSTGANEWWDTVETDGDDIRVTDSSDMLLPIDLIKFDHGARTGLLAIKRTAKVSPEEFRIWCGNSALIKPPVGDPNGQYAAYDSNYKGFYPDGGGNDRTINANHFTMVNSPTVSTGGSAISGFDSTTYNGSSQYGIVKSTDFNTGEPGTASLTCLVNVDANDNDGIYLGLGYSNVFTTDTHKRSFYCRRGDLSLDLKTIIRSKSGNTNTAQVTSTLANATWGFSAGTIDIIICDIRKNGVGLDTANQFSTTGSHDILTVGIQPQLFPNDNHFDGLVSAIGAHTVKRPGNWTLYQHAMLTGQTAFWNTWTWVTP